MLQYSLVYHYPTVIKQWNSEDYETVDRLADHHKTREPMSQGHDQLII